MTANEIKFIKKLHQKKYRLENKQYIIEGKKLIQEAIENCPNSIERILFVDLTLEFPEDIKTTKVSEKEMSRITSLKNPSDYLAIMKMKEMDDTTEKKTIYLEDIKDPGNMGTIIRTADWFGISKIYLSENCVDIYNPKVIQSTMGSFFRVALIEKRMEDIENLSLIGATLDGKNIDDFNSPESFCLVIGNESKGISSESLKRLDAKVKIPGYGQAESLNASIAAGILMYAFSKPKN